MPKQTSIKNYKFLILFLILTSTAFLFYWFQIRPAQIKHECSWVKMHVDAKPGRPSMTKEQLIEKGIIRSCKAEIDALHKADPSKNYQLGDMSVHTIYSPMVNGVIRAMSTNPLEQATSCIEDGNKVITEYKNPVPAVPVKDWYEKASPQEYQFCLHNNGL
jgi:hypothetical protein